MANTSWSTTDKGSASLVLSGGNLTVTASGVVTANIRSIDRLASAAKFYFEITFTTGLNPFVGIASAGTPITSSIASTTNACLITGTPGTIYLNGVSTGTALGAFTAGQAAGVAVDLGNQLIWFRNSSAAGNWNNSATANPVSGTGGISIASAFGPAIPAYAFASFIGASSGTAVTANFGDATFVASAPSGFVSGFTAGAVPTLYAVNTQTAIEQWSPGTPVAQATQLAVEEWATVATGNVQALATQISLEMWASVAQQAVVTGSSPGFVAIMA